MKLCAFNRVVGWLHSCISRRVIFVVISVRVWLLAWSNPSLLPLALSSLFLRWGIFSAFCCCFRLLWIHRRFFRFTVNCACDIYTDTHTHTYNGSTRFSIYIIVEPRALCAPCSVFSPSSFNKQLCRICIRDLIKCICDYIRCVFTVPHNEPWKKRREQTKKLPSPECSCPYSLYAITYGEYYDILNWNWHQKRQTINTPIR